MRYFENVDILKREINNLGLDMLEGFLTENKEKLEKIFNTMDVLKPFLRDTIEFVTLMQNRISVETHLEIKAQIESEGKKYTVDKEFTVLAIGEGEKELEEIKLYFKTDKITAFEDVAIRANALYVSRYDEYSFEAVSDSEIELEEILFFDTKKSFKRKFMNNNAREIIKEKNLYNTELVGINIEVI